MDDKISYVDVETVNHGTHHLKQIYSRIEQKTYVEWDCPTCKVTHKTSKQKFKNKVYSDCYTCYQKSQNRSTTALKVVENRRSYDGKDNPNWRNKREEMVCKCGKTFIGLIYDLKWKWQTTEKQKYCSVDCRNKYSVSITKPYLYNGIKFRIEVGRFIS